MQCNKCGACCKLFNLPNFPQGEEYQKYNSGNGVCINLVKNQCVIYEDRPVFCNVEKLYKEQYSSIMTREEYDKFITQQCQNTKNICKGLNL